MKVMLHIDDAYPVYWFSKKIALPGERDVIVDVPDETIARWKRIQDEYQAMQDELEILHSHE